ncbi:transglycosylase family protein [Gordonia sihwensis]|uniref:transglycosylase family protein n=1 Tax=Gordonia sihwensis TaxID=173559 RepID=UPI000697CA5F|nr:transglycosylase family protein [Gordonia sihwensis]
MTTPNAGRPPRQRVSAGTPSGGKKPDSTKKKVANEAVRKGAASAITGVTGGAGAPLAVALTSLIGTDEKAKKRRRQLILAGVAVFLAGALLITALLTMALGSAILGGGSGAAGTSSVDNGTCLDITAPRITEGSGQNTNGRTAAAGSLGAPLDAQYMQSASGFGGRDAPTAGATSWHDGIDFSGPGIHGKPIYAVADGVVEQAGHATGYGNWILINHTIGGKPVTTLYGHIEDGHLKVKAGDKVKAGQQIADVGNAGVSTGPHLHFGVYPGGWKQGAGVDPMPWLSKFKAASSNPQTGSNPQPQNPPNGGDGPRAPADAVTEADWDKLAALESGGNWKINTGNGFSGGVQFTASTWAANGGTEFAPEAWKATKEQQMEVANEVLRTQGWGAWPPSERAGIRGKKPAPKGTFYRKGAAPAQPAPAPGPATDLPKSPKGDERNLQSAAQRGMRLAAQQFPEVQTIGGFRSGNDAKDHGTGTAIDIMVPDYQSESGIALGDKIAKFYIDHAGDLKVKYVIWRNKIWQGGSWSDYGSGGDDNAKHNNHVHVSFKQSGPPTSTVPGVEGATPAGGADSAPDGAQPYTPKGDQKSQNLSPEQQANIKALISAARRSGIKPEGRAAVLAIAYAGAQTNFVSITPTPEDKRTGIFGEIKLEGSDSGDLTNLVNVPYAADRFMDRLKEVAGKDRGWASKSLSDVLVEMYPEQATRGPEFGSWEQLSIGAVTKLWADPSSAANAMMQRVSADVECSQGVVGGRNLKPGSVPERFVKWIELAGQICEGMTAPLLAAQIEQESGFNEQATSGTGAMGSSQFMPGTWPTWGKKVDDNGKPIGPGGSGDPRSAADATMAQGHMMCNDYDAIVKLISEGKVKGDPVALTLAAYNAGLGAVISAGGMPSGGDYSTQTQPYAEKIMARAKEFDGGGGNLTGGNGGTGAGDGKYKEIVAVAMAQRGKPYVWGARGPDSFDCSGLMQYAYKKATGVDIGGWTGAQYPNGIKISQQQAKPGDLVFSAIGEQGGAPGHVAMYIGDGKVVEAQQAGVPVKVSPVPKDGVYMQFPLDRQYKNAA